jgi:biotin carboxyl carrier protein
MRRYKIEINKTTHVLDVEQQAPNLFTVLFPDGRLAEVALLDEERPTIAASAVPEVPPSGPIPPQPAAPATPGTPGQATVSAPMPGVVLSFEVSEGDTVSRGQTLLVLEAMKMKNEIRSERDGVIAKIYPAAGAQVRHGELLMEFEQ